VPSVLASTCPLSIRCPTFTVHDALTFVFDLDANSMLATSNSMLILLFSISLCAIARSVVAGAVDASADTALFWPDRDSLQT
jgi:hypothetical protein